MSKKTFNTTEAGSAGFGVDTKYRKGSAVFAVPFGRYGYVRTARRMKSGAVLYGVEFAKSGGFALLTFKELKPAKAQVKAIPLGVVYTHLRALIQLFRSGRPVKPSAIDKAINLLKQTRPNPLQKLAVMQAAANLRKAFNTLHKYEAWESREAQEAMLPALQGAYVDLGSLVGMRSKGRKSPERAAAALVELKTLFPQIKHELEERDITRLSSLLMQAVNAAGAMRYSKDAAIAEAGSTARAALTRAYSTVRSGDLTGSTRHLSEAWRAINGVKQPQRSTSKTAPEEEKPDLNKAIKALTATAIRASQKAGDPVWLEKLYEEAEMVRALVQTDALKSADLMPKLTELEEAVYADVNPEWLERVKKAAEPLTLEPA